MPDEVTERRLVTLCVQAAERRKSVLTQWVHTHYQNPLAWDTIPVYENFCYVLGLLRTRKGESILEAKSLLERLLPFEISGNFPIYLHEFPRSHRRSLGIHILPLLNAIVRHFSPVLGRNIIDCIEEVIQRVLSEGEALHRDRPLPDATWAKWLACAHPEALIDFEPRIERVEEWADYWIALQEAFARGAKVIDRLRSVCGLWNSKKHLFLGPQFFIQGEPAVTLFDLAMGCVFGEYSARALNPSHLLVHLQASVLWPVEGLLDLPPSSEHLKLNEYEIVEDQETRTLFFGGESRLYSFCTTIDPLVLKKRAQVEKFSRYEVEYSFMAPLEDAEREEEIPLSVFWSFGDATRVDVNGTQATVFRLEDRVCFSTSDQSIQIEMRIQKIAGEGEFLGRISFGNRPPSAQDGIWDWKVILRTLRRSPTCVLSLVLTVKE